MTELINIPEQYVLTMDSPIGRLQLREAGGAIVALDFCDGIPLEGPTASGSHLTEEARRQLLAYFKRQLTVFDLPLNPEGTPFQKRVWKELMEIPFGATASYRALSRRMGNEKALRAVGAANGKNPLPVIIPCHRVIGAGGELVGYSGGIWRKKWLLVHEGNAVQSSLPF